MAILFVLLLFSSFLNAAEMSLQEKKELIESSAPGGPVIYASKEDLQKELSESDEESGQNSESELDQSDEEIDDDNCTEEWVEFQIIKSLVFSESFL